MGAGESERRYVAPSGREPDWRDDRLWGNRPLAAVAAGDRYGRARCYCSGDKWNPHEGEGYSTTPWLAIKARQVVAAAFPSPKRHAPNPAPVPLPSGPKCPNCGRPLRGFAVKHSSFNCPSQAERINRPSYLSGRKIGRNPSRTYETPRFDSWLHSDFRQALEDKLAKELATAMLAEAPETMLDPERRALTLLFGSHLPVRTAAQMAELERAYAAYVRNFGEPQSDDVDMAELARRRTSHKLAEEMHQRHLPKYAPELCQRCGDRPHTPRSLLCVYCQKERDNARAAAGMQRARQQKGEALDPAATDTHEAFQREEAVEQDTVIPDGDVSNRWFGYVAPTPPPPVVIFATLLDYEEKLLSEMRSIRLETVSAQPERKLPEVEGDELPPDLTHAQYVRQMVARGDRIAFRRWCKLVSGFHHDEKSSSSAYAAYSVEAYSRRETIRWGRVWLTLGEAGYWLRLRSQQNDETRHRLHVLAEAGFSKLHVLWNGGFGPNAANAGRSLYAGESKNAASLPERDFMYESYGPESEFDTN